MKGKQVLDALAAHRNELRERLGIRSFALFGSMAREEAGAPGDVDLLVEFDRPITLFDLVAAQQHLEHLLGVPKVDLVLRDCILPELEAGILREAIHVE